MVRVERSSFFLCICGKAAHGEEGVYTWTTDIISNIRKYSMVHVVSPNEPNDLARENEVME